MSVCRTVRICFFFLAIFVFPAFFVLKCSKESNPLKSVILDGATYIEISNSSSLQRINGDRLTVEIWASAAEGSDDNVQALFMIGDNSGRDEIAIFKGLGDSLILCFVDNRNLSPLYLEDLDLTSSSFHFYVLVVDSPYVEFYFDGERVQRESFSNLDIDIGTSNALIGADYDAANSDVGNLWEGTIDEVRLWDRALTTSEISFHYKNPDKLTEHYSSDGLDNLIGIWRFNQQSGSTIPDGSGNGNNGIVLPSGSVLTWSHEGVSP